MSRRIAHAFAAFARSGNPGTEGLEWPVFELEKKETMLFDLVSRSVAESYKEIYRVIYSVMNTRK